MNLFQFMILTSLVINLSIGFFVLFSQPGRRVNQCFLILCAIIAAWNSTLWGGANSADPGDAVFFIRMASITAALIPAGMNLLRISILYPGDPLMLLMARNRGWFLAWLAAMLLCLTPFFLISASLPQPGEVLAKPNYGPGFIGYSVYFLLAQGVLFRLMIQSRRMLQGVKKAEIEYVLLSCGASLFIGVFFLIVPNLTGWIDLGAFLPLSAIVFLAVIGYGIATQGILDVPVVARRVIAYAILTVYLVLLYWVVLHSAEIVLVRAGTPTQPLAPLLAAFVVVFSVSPAQGIAQRMASRLFINTPPLKVGRILGDASRALNTILTVDQLSEAFQQILRDSLEVTELRIFMREPQGFVQISPVSTRPPVAVDALLPSLLNSSTQLWVRELIPRRKVTQELVDIQRTLKEENAAAVIGIRRQNRLVGYLLMGPRASGRIYGQEESAAVEGLRDLFAVSYENARLYTEVQNGRIYMDLLLANLVNGVIATDAAGKITTCNQEAARVLEVRPADLLGGHLVDLPAPLAELLRSVHARDLVIRDREIQLLSAQKATRILNAGASLFRDLEGKVVGSLLVLQDQTDLRALEDQVRRSERLASLGTLSAGMAHEIKNPLVTLKTFTQLLPERFEDPDYRETFVNLAGREIGRIDSLVNQLLSFARPVKPRLSPLHLHQLLSDHLKLFREQAEEKGVRLRENYSAERDVVAGDADQLQQVLLNLLLNAQQALSENGEIRVSTRQTGPRIEVAIADNGLGISPQDLDHVFDPFFTTKSSGTGLGLAVAHQILKEHGAEVKVTSEPGRGSVFCLYFPLFVGEVDT